MPVAVEALRHIPGRRHALEGLDHGLAHVALDARVGHTQRQSHVETQLDVVLEEVRVAGEQLAHYLVVRLFPFRVPHLLIAAQREHIYRFVNFAVSFQHAGLVCKWSRVGIIRVLGTHHFGN